MRIRISNNTHPAELQVVGEMLRQQGLKPKKTGPNALECEVPTETWFTAVKEAVEFMTECFVEKVGG